MLPWLVLDCVFLWGTTYEGYFKNIHSLLLRPVIMFQILMSQIHTLMLEQCQGNAQTSVLVTVVNSRRCYVLGKPIFVFTSQASTTMLKRLFLVLQYQAKAYFSAVRKTLCLCFVECQIKLMVSSGLNMCDFDLCLNLTTFISKA